LEILVWTLSAKNYKLIGKIIVMTLKVLESISLILKMEKNGLNG